MQQSKLVCLLRHLNTKELGRFEDYVYSPFFNKHQEVRRLCTYLNKYVLDEKKQHRLDKHKVFKHLYKDRPFDANALHGITAKLLVLLHDFLVILHRTTQQNNQHYIEILAQLRKRKQFKDYEAVLRKIERHTEHNYTDVEDWYWEKFHYHDELDVRFVNQGGRFNDENLQLKNDFLDRFFIIKKLKIACEMINRNRIIGTDYEYRLVEELLAYIEDPNSPYAQEPIILIYVALLYMVLDQDSDEQFKQAKTLLRVHKEAFSQIELKNIYDYLDNHCIKQYNATSDEHYLHELLDIYKYLVEHQINFVDGYLLDGDYKNIGTIAISAQDYQWAAKFIEEYRTYLLPQHQTSVYALLKGYLAHAQKEYRQALLALHDVHFTNYTYHLGAKIIQVKIYYETEEGEAFYSLTDTFRSYIKRNEQIPKRFKIAYDNFIALVRHAYRILENQAYWKDEKVIREYQKLQERLATTSVVASRSWLIAQINDLAPKNLLES